eukprot:TRINITY_DN524_c0_g1_i1.p1 TRINITY_DN524_c0_g1~~TRINITY_DN524_c0_g1_i1.p1  ORF type:complete len:315 (+),score=34.85 TRINITY_DN524_c0_g1_i1:30-974(+)
MAEIATIGPSKRVKRHRETEALRRKRTKTVVKELKDLLHLSDTLDQTSVFEAALTAVKELIELKKAMGNSLQTQTSPILTDAFDVSSLEYIPEDLIMSAPSLPLPSTLDLANTTIFVGTLPSVPDSPATTSASLPSPQVDVVDDDTMLDLELPLPLVPVKPKTTTLNSPYLRQTVGLCIMAADSFGLDSNQNALDMLRAPAWDSLRVHWANSSLLVEPKLSDLAFHHLYTTQASTLTFVEQMRRFDNTCFWVRTNVVRLDDNGDISDPASIAANFQPSFLVISQPSDPPRDGRARIYSDGHLVHVAEAKDALSL